MTGSVLLGDERNITCVFGTQINRKSLRQSPRERKNACVREWKDVDSGDIDKNMQHMWDTERQTCHV